MVFLAMPGAALGPRQSGPGGTTFLPPPAALQERLEAESVRVEDNVVVDFRDPAVELG